MITARELDSLRNTSRNGGFCVSEYGAGANPAQHEQNPEHPKPGRPVASRRMAGGSSRGCMGGASRQRPFVWGSFVWCMFDFAVNTRHEGGQPGLNDKGLVTRDRKTKKDAFYFYKANWSDEPVLYITSRRFTERTNAVTDVKIYSNAAKVKLLLNGVSQGKRSDGTNCVFVWKEVRLSPGENQVEARAERDGKSLTDSCAWMLK